MFGGLTLRDNMADILSRVMRIPKADIQPPPDTIASLAGEYLVGVARLADRMQLLLDIEKVLGGDATAGLLPAASATCLPPNA